MPTVTANAYNVIFHLTHGNPDTPTGWNLMHGPSAASTSPGSTGTRLRVYDRQTDPGETNVVFTYSGSQPANYTSHPMEATIVNANWLPAGTPAPAVIGTNVLVDVGGSSFTIDPDRSDYPAHTSDWFLVVATAGDEAASTAGYPGQLTALPERWVGPSVVNDTYLFLGDNHYATLFRYLWNDDPDDNADPASWTLNEWAGIHDEVIAYALFEVYDVPPSSISAWTLGKVRIGGGNW